jgi:hypothetical protein
MDCHLLHKAYFLATTASISIRIAEADGLLAKNVGHVATDQSNDGIKIQLALL